MYIYERQKLPYLNMEISIKQNLICICIWATWFVVLRKQLIYLYKNCYKYIIQFGMEIK